MLDKDFIMKQHLGNISRQVGRDVAKKYNYILSQEELERSYWESMHDLAYELKKEVSRDRYVFNAKGMEKEINRICQEAIAAASKEMAEMVAEDVAEEVAAQLNGLVQTGSGQIVLGGGGSRRSGRSSGASSRFAQQLAKGLVKGVSKLVDEMIDPKETRRR